MKELDIQKNGKPCIYTIKNVVNNKLYIGSAIGHYRRKGQHYYMLRRNIHFNKHLQSSWNKYGESNFTFEILEFIPNTNDLEKKEIYYIALHDVLDPAKGYNTRKNCITNLGLKWPLASRLRFSESKKGKKILHLDYKEVAKKNMKKVKAIHKKSKKILTFLSAKQAGEKLSIDRTCISKALNKRIKSAGGYIWDFAEQSAPNNSVNSEKP